MEFFKRHWQRTPRVIRRPVIFVIGWVVVAAGLVMLVTPGPGWATIFVGFAILATEYTSAAVVRDWLVSRLKQLIKWCQKLWASLTKQ